MITRYAVLNWDGISIISFLRRAYATRWITMAERTQTVKRRSDSRAQCRPNFLATTSALAGAPQEPLSSTSGAHPRNTSQRLASERGALRSAMLLGA
jgi:hypothetical protein